MADGTHIEWTDATWNPITGCSIVSPGCTNCYAMRLAGTRLKHTPSRAGLTNDSKAGPVWNGKVRLNEQWLDQPLRWRRPRKIFVCAHGDLFAENVPDEWIDRVFAVMALAPHHTFQVLTKRAAGMRSYVSALPGRADAVARAAACLWPGPDGDVAYYQVEEVIRAPLPNVWLGVSAERQKEANERVSLLIHTPAAMRFVSAEPLLGPILFTHLVAGTAPIMQYEDALVGKFFANHRLYDDLPREKVDWIIVGGESGPGARPMHPDWVRSIRDQCADAGTAFFFKQWGAYLPAGQMIADGRPWSPISGNSLHASKALAGRFLDGVEHNAMPELPA